MNAFSIMQNKQPPRLCAGNSLVGYQQITFPYPTPGYNTTAWIQIVCAAVSFTGWSKSNISLCFIQFYS